VNQAHSLWEHLRFLDLLVVLDEWVLDRTAFGIVNLHKSAAGGVFVHGIHDSVGAMVLLLHQIIVLGTCSSLLLLFTVGKGHLTSFKCSQLLFGLSVTLYHFEVLAVFQVSVSFTGVKSSSCLRTDRAGMAGLLFLGLLPALTSICDPAWRRVGRFFYADQAIHFFGICVFYHHL
jgi:hypothetical protein